MNTFTHIDPQGNPSMVDVSEKAVTKRIAKARSVVVLDDEIMRKLQNDEIHTKKGPVFQTAIIAGVMAAKRTGELIPLCHPIGLENCQIDIKVSDNQEVEVICTASVTSKRVSRWRL